VLFYHKKVRKVAYQISFRRKFYSHRAHNFDLLNTINVKKVLVHVTTRCRDMSESIAVL